jgi:dimethylglycine dehydrogenase
VPWDYAQTELQPDIDHIADFIENGIYRFPIMGDTGFKHVTDGPITYTPNGDPLVGTGLPVERTSIHACGYSFGITQAGGIGHYLAGWIMNGEPEIDLWSVDSRRYGGYANWAYNHEKIEDTYPRLYAIICPNDWRDAARPKPYCAHLRVPEAGRCRVRRLLRLGVSQLFCRQNRGQSRSPGLEAQQQRFKYVAAECKHVMEKVGHAGPFTLSPKPVSPVPGRKPGSTGPDLPERYPSISRPHRLVPHAGQQRQLQVGHDRHQNEAG